MTYTFLSSYLFPKVSIFDHSRWKNMRDQTIYDPGLEACALTMGPLKVSPWHLAKIFENHYIQSNGNCPGTNVDLIALF